MSWKEWKHDLDEANKAYDSGRIEREVYETRIKYALCMIYPMRRKTPCFSYGDIRRVHRIYASN